MISNLLKSGKLFLFIIVAIIVLTKSSSRLEAHEKYGHVTQEDKLGSET